MKHFEVIFKSGTSIIITAEKCSSEVSNIDGSLVGYYIEGVEENFPLYLNVQEVAGIFQIEV